VMAMTIMRERERCRRNDDDSFVTQTSVPQYRD
jgi:hypothetical protein